MKSLLMTLAALAAGVSLTAAAEPTPSDRLERAIHLEEARGDLEQASRIYRELVDAPGTPEALRNQAQQRLSLAAGKQGTPRDSAEAPPAEQRPAAPAEPTGGPPVAAALQEAVALIESTSAQGVDREALLAKTLQALAASVDGESEYLTAEQLQEMSHSFDQQLVGVGIQLHAADGQVVVAAAIPGSPAETAGVLPDDRIVAIGERNLADVPEPDRLKAAVNLLRGPAGEDVTFQVARGDKMETLTVRRAAIALESVRGDRRDNRQWQYLLDADNKIGYIRILQFGRKTADEVRQALAQLKDARGLILDLRDNPGGLLAQGAAVCDLFVDEGTIVTVRGSDGKTQTIEATREEGFGDLPLVVLVNRTTGSTAEVVASCLRDHGRAVVVGERTWGRGIVQSILPLKTAGGALRLTTGVFVRPNGETIHRAKDVPPGTAGGVLPSPGMDVAYSAEELEQHQHYRHKRDVEPDAAPPAGYEDRQLAKALAVLRERIRP